MIVLPKLIGVCGRAGSGKDVAANYLTTRFNYTNYKMSGPLKRALCAMFNLSEEVIENRKDDFSIDGTTLRRMMQTLGTEWGRETISEDIWLSIFDDWRRENEDTPVVVSDIRFDNEAEYILEEGGVIVEVVRPFNRKVEGHGSELGISEDLVSHVVHNDSDIISFLQRFRLTLELLAVRAGVQIVSVA